MLSQFDISVSCFNLELLKTIIDHSLFSSKVTHLGVSSMLSQFHVHHSLLEVLKTQL